MQMKIIIVAIQLDLCTYATKQFKIVHIKGNIAFIINVIISNINIIIAFNIVCEENSVNEYQQQKQQQQHEITDKWAE